MKLRIATPVFAFVVVIAVFALGQDRPADDRNGAAVATALDYSDGGYSGDADRIARALHPDLNKLFFVRRSPAAAPAALYSTVSGLVEMTRLGTLNLEPEKRKTDVAVLEITDDVACVRLRSSQWCDYLQMIKDGGRWKIVNVLWTAGLDAPPARRLVADFDAGKERPAAAAAAADFLEGQLAGDPARLEKALHPETNLVVYQVNAKSGAALLNRNRYTALLGMAKAGGAQAANAGKPEVRVLDLMDGLAYVAARTARGEAYLQMQLLDGQWKVINALVRPTQNIVQPPPPAKKQAAANG